MTAPWLRLPLLTFDIESTGVDPMNDRIVTASAIQVNDDGVGPVSHWLVNPGVPIPAGATAIHGITDEAAAKYHPALTAVPFIGNALRAAWREEMPVVACNASFDLTMLRSELERYAQEPIIIGPVLDPLVIDRAIDPYRKGKRTLSALAQHYGVKQDGAHSSEGDALTAARVVWRMASHPKAPQISLEEMQEFQRAAHAKWAEGFEAYRRSKGFDEAISRDWPVRSTT